MNVNNQLGLRTPNRWSNFANPDKVADPIEPEFQDAAIDVENIADEELRDVATTAEDIAKDALDKAKQIGSLAASEGQSALNALNRSTQRLDSQDRVISFIPNSLLLYGLVGLGVYFLMKK